MTYFPCNGMFVNDAFGTAHRAHASNVGISANVEKAVLKHIEGCATMSDIQSTYNMSDKNETN